MNTKKKISVFRNEDEERAFWQKTDYQIYRLENKESCPLSNNLQPQLR